MHLYVIYVLYSYALIKLFGCVMGNHMASLLASSVIDRVFKPRSGLKCDRSWVQAQIKPSTINFVFPASPLSTFFCMQLYGERSHTCWLRIGKMCSSGETCLPEDCCFKIELSVLV